MPKKDELPQNPKIPCQICARWLDWPYGRACLWIKTGGETPPEGCRTQRLKNPVTGEPKDYPAECPEFVPSERWKKSGRKQLKV